MLVDHDHDLIEMYQPYLKQHGYNVKAAYNSEEAKTIFQEFDPDIIFCDLVMEHFDSGFVLCHWMNRQPEREKRWVVIFTSTGHETGYRFSTQTKEEKTDQRGRLSG
ncbi:MAG: response regulator [Candidatus Marinimicrobia bacterium]|nr:response regulator [Candidatus Neomarinimicrobiota bacterium]